MADSLAESHRPAVIQAGAQPKGKSAFISAMGNFSIQYNLSAASVAIPIMNDKFPQSGWVGYVLMGLIFAGAVVGMCVMGYLGDLVGRKRALIITLSLTVFGSLGCAIFPWGYDPDVIYIIISICRFILGVGVGGIFPLSAVAASEGTTVNQTSNEAVGRAFFWQSPGCMCPYLVGIFVLLLPDWGGYTTTEIQFRILMGLGAIPAGIVLAASFQYEDSAVYQKSHTRFPLREAFEHRAYWGLLAGTAGTWFLYDVAYYGTNIFTPQIIQSIFGDESNMQSCWHSLVAQAIGVPGCVLAIWALERKGVYWLMLYGFWIIAALFAVFAHVYNEDPDGSSVTKYVIYCLLTCALNFGPNVATYVLPTTCFPPEVCSLFNGLSAASAKMGAVFGTYAFVPVSNALGIAGLMWMQAGICVLGAFVTMKFVVDDRKILRANVGERTPLITVVN